MEKKVKPLVYPFTFEEWKAHPSTKPALAWCKKQGAKKDKEIAERKKFGEQTELNL
jgi:hypothetical protein